MQLGGGPGVDPSVAALGAGEPGRLSMCHPTPPTGSSRRGSGAEGGRCREALWQVAPATPISPLPNWEHPRAKKGW